MVATLLTDTDSALRSAYLQEVLLLSTVLDPCSSKMPHQAAPVNVVWNLPGVSDPRVELWDQSLHFNSTLRSSVCTRV